MVGKYWARAAPIRAFAAIRSCSAWRRSGRRSSSSDGSPAGTGGGTSACSGWPARIGPGLRPSRTDSAFSCWPIRASRRGISTSEASYSDWVWDSSSSDTVPPSNLSLNRRNELSRLAAVSRAICSSRSSSRKAMYEDATDETRISTVARRPSSLASTWACAASVSRRRLPNRSSSQLSDSAASYWSWTGSTNAPELPAGRRPRVPSRFAPTCGSSSERVLAYWPRNSSMRLAAIWTSLFSRSATAISSSSTGSRNCPHHAVFAISPASPPWKRKVCGASIAGRL
jgi:hypothetical protein